MTNVDFSSEVFAPIAADVERFMGNINFSTSQLESMIVQWQNKNHLIAAGKAMDKLKNNYNHSFIPSTKRMMDQWSDSGTSFVAIEKEATNEVSSETYRYQNRVTESAKSIKQITMNFDKTKQQKTNSSEIKKLKEQLLIFLNKLEENFAEDASLQNSSNDENTGTSGVYSVLAETQRAYLEYMKKFVSDMDMNLEATLKAFSTASSSIAEDYSTRTSAQTAEKNSSKAYGDLKRKMDHLFPKRR